MIEHQQNGYLAQPYNSEELAQGIAWVLQDKQRWQALRIELEKKLSKSLHLRFKPVDIWRYIKTFYQPCLQVTRGGSKLYTYIR
jgi:glycosyltransferase involved in cell wall biosynthesis